MKATTEEIKTTIFCEGIQINLAVNGSPDDFTVEIQGLSQFNTSWLGKIYRNYEGHIWTKCANIENRMMFRCLICDKLLCRFCSLRNHINMHLQIFPFKCYACEKEYPSRNSLNKHRVAKHKGSDAALSSTTSMLRVDWDNLAS